MPATRRLPGGPSAFSKKVTLAPNPSRAGSALQAWLRLGPKGLQGQLDPSWASVGMPVSFLVYSMAGGTLLLLGGSEMSQWGDRTKDAQGGSAQDPEYAESGGAVDFRAGEGPGLISGNAGPPREDAEQGRDVVRGVF